MEGLSEQLPPEAGRLARELGRLAADARMEAFLVGGPVRDLALGQANLDLDLAVEGDAVQLARRAARQWGGEVKTHARFGTATVILPDGQKVDLATTRAERYPRPGALPEVEPAPLAEDLRRRDFSVNAMALALSPYRFGELVDPFGGEADLRARALRALHPASFRDDPTRILRGVRLGRRLGFHLEPETEGLAVEAIGSGAFDTLTPERLRSELDRLLEEPGALAGIVSLEVLGFWAWFAPGLALDLELLARLPRAVAKWEDQGAPLRGPLVFLSAVVAPLGAAVAVPTAAFRLRLAPDEQRVMNESLAAPEKIPPAWRDRRPRPSEVVECLHPLPTEALAFLEARVEAPPIQKLLDSYRAEWQAIRLEITGHDLIAAGWPPGPAMGAAMRATLAAKLDGKIGGREAELRFAEAWLEREGG